MATALATVRSCSASTPIPSSRMLALVKARGPRPRRLERQHPAGATLPFMPSAVAQKQDEHPVVAHGGSTASHRASSLNRRDFFAAVVAGVRQALPPELADFHHRANSMLLKIDYGNERIHYEVWTDGMRGRVEIGLHFEDGPLSTAAYLAFFDARIIEIKHRLGSHVELERWT